MSTTYYRGPDVVITDDVFVVWTPQPQTFRIAELESVHVVRGSRHPAQLVLGLAAVLAVVGVIATWPLIHSPGAYLVAFAVVTTPPALAGACGRLTPREYELRATYRNVELLLFSSANTTTFGQVRRGLSRAFGSRARASEGRRYGSERFAGAGYGEW